MIRRGFRVLFVVIFVALVLKGCLVKDVPQIQSSTQIYQERQAKIYPIPENITLNGIDYLQSQAPVGIFGGELITSTIGEGPKTFNPFNSKDNTSSTMAGIMYDGLLTTDPISGKPIPKLAKSYEISPNGVDYIIKLRKGIKWSDGKLITADDVVFTWQDIIFAGFGDTSIRDSLAIDGQLPSVEKLDNYTVKFTTPKPYAPFIRMLSTPIAPKHVFYPAIKKGSSYFDSFLSTNTNPEDFVVSGAFKLKEYVPAQRVVFEKNPNYYEINKNGDKLPYLDRLIYLIVGDLNNEVLKYDYSKVYEILDKEKDKSITFLKKSLEI